MILVLKIVCQSVCILKYFSLYQCVRVIIQQFLPIWNWVSHMFIFLQMNANDPSILSGYLQKSMDRGKTWSKRWFVVTKEFAMYEFKAHHVSICIWILQQCWRVHTLVLKVLFSVYTDTRARFNRLESVTEVCHCIFFFPFSSQTGYICHSNPTITWLPSNISCGQHRECVLLESPAETSSHLPAVRVYGKQRQVKMGHTWSIQ